MATPPRNGALYHLRRAALACAGGGVTDAQLLGRFRCGGDGVAFAELVRRHGPMVHGVCRRVLGDHHAAEDAFQAAFLTLARRAAVVEPGSVGPWLHGVATRTALKARAAAVRRRARERSCPADRPAAEPADALPDWRPLLDRELARLPDHYRLPVVLCDLEGRPRKDVARQLGIPAGTLSSRLAAARKLLAARLRRRGLAPAVAAAVTVPPALAARAAAAAAPVGPLLPASPPTRGPLTMLPRRVKIAATVLLGALAGAVFGVPMRATPQPAPPTRPAPAPPAAGPKKPGDPPGPLLPTTRVLKLDEDIRSVVWGPDGTLMASRSQRIEGTGEEAVYFSTIKLWDAKTGAEKLSLGEVKNPGTVDLAISPDNATLAVSSRHTIQDGDKVELWDTKTGERKRTITMDYGRSPPRIAFSPDGKLIAVAYGGPSSKLAGGARVFDTQTGELKHTLLGHTSIAVTVAFAPGGKSLATGGDQHDHTVLFWDLASGRPGGTLKSGSFAILSLAHSPDGKRIAVGSGGDDGKVRVWGLPESGPQLTLDMGGGVQRVVFSRDGRLVAAAGQAPKEDGRVLGVVRLWNAQTGDLLHTWEGTSSTSLAFGADGQTLAILYPGGVVKVVPAGKTEE